MVTLVMVLLLLVRMLVVVTLVTLVTMVIMIMPASNSFDDKYLILMCKIQNIGLLTGDLWEGIDQGDVDPMIINWMDIDNMEQHDSI